LFHPYLASSRRYGSKAWRLSSTGSRGIPSFHQCASWRTPTAHSSTPHRTATQSPLTVPEEIPAPHAVLGSAESALGSPSYRASIPSCHRPTCLPVRATARPPAAPPSAAGQPRVLTVPLTRSAGALAPYRTARCSHLPLPRP